nr:MAG TPA: hypothetical protein [Caudoviricetes sp.]
MLNLIIQFFRPLRIKINSLVCLPGTFIFPGHLKPVKGR